MPRHCERGSVDMATKLTEGTRIMIRLLKDRMASLAVLAAVFLTAMPALAQEAPAAVPGVSDETQYILNTFLFLFSGVLVMWMAAGFAMLESGLVRSKNTTTICLKNVALYAIAGLMYYIIGYNLMYVDVSGYIGSFSFLYDPAPAELGLISGDIESPADLIGAGTYASMSDWFFQMVFVATAASIVSGTVAERIRLWPFLIFVVVLTAIIYSIQGAWSWGGGWLSEMGFADFAGSTIVHSVGGWSALTGALILGPRIGKYGKNGEVNPMPGSNLPLATLGTFILWMGWFGFNGGSQLAMGSALDAAAISNVMVNTNMAACGGTVAAMLLSQVIYKKVDLTFALNGALAGLVAITAGPDLASPLVAIIVGVIGGILTTLAVPVIDRMKIDDVVGAISVHLVSGIWGTLAVGIFGGGNIVVQLTGVIAVGVFAVVTSTIVWLALKYTIGLRPNEETEIRGLDSSECGLEAYPEFGVGSQRI